MSIEYASFLIRLWRKSGPDTAPPLADWCSQIEHIQSGQSWTFSTLDELLDFLHQQAQKPHALNEHWKPLDGRKKIL